jgi:endoglucanase
MENYLAVPEGVKKMPDRRSVRSSRYLSILFLALLLLVFLPRPAAAAASAYIRVSQVGYETANAPFQAYLMSTASESRATFSVINSEGNTAYVGTIGSSPIGTWSNKSVTYDVYSLSFTVPGGDIYTISVSSPIQATSPKFAVNTPNSLYPGLLLNTLWFYETEEDGPAYIPNALRTEPGHLNDANATIYNTPPIKDDSQDNINYKPPTSPLVPAQLPNVNAEGGWWDAGDYVKYVETTSYTVALMEIGIRDFPNQMGPGAPSNPAPPPGCCGVGQTSASYAGTASGAPASSDFSDSAQFGVNWLMEMWNDSTKTLYYQVDNSQDWDYYGYGYSPQTTSATGICGGSYSTSYCLINEYDIWTLPQAADNFSLPELFPASDSPPALNQPCDQYSTYYICFRPVFLAASAGSPISPNLAGRMAAAFAEYYQLYSVSDPTTADTALLYAEDIFALASTSLSDPANSVSNGTCSKDCLLTSLPFDGYPETVWDDDMELGATELYIALQSAGGNLPPGLPVTNPMTYLTDAAQYANSYITKIYNGGYEDTLNLYDVSGLAHFELYRALGLAGNPGGLAVNQTTILNALENQLEVAKSQASKDVWGFGVPWGAAGNGDTTSHGAGLSVMASELYYLTGTSSYNTYSQRWLANILGANSWGSSFIVGDGSTFPNCIAHQVANLAGATGQQGTVAGTLGGTPILWGAAVEGPASDVSVGTVPGMILCPAKDSPDTFAIFNGNDGTFNTSEEAVYRDNVQSYTTTEPAIDLTATSFLMFAWRMAGSPNPLP